MYKGVGDSSGNAIPEEWVIRLPNQGKKKDGRDVCAREWPLAI